VLEMLAGLAIVGAIVQAIVGWAAMVQAWTWAMG
jgi:hypothetical protein